jgi:ATP citrate (pro-S)-lyase
MLDFDFSCGRETPSVAAMIYPFRWSPYSEILLGNEGDAAAGLHILEEAVKKHS